MINKQYSSPLLDQTKDLIWVVDHGFCLLYANKAYLNLMKEVTGKEKKLNEQILVEGFGDGYIEKWKAYYERGLNGEQFEIQEHFCNSNTNQVEYSQISFNPIIDENQVVVNVACQSRDITSIIKSNNEAENILDASLDVICSFDHHGIFTKVSAACKELWGYEKHELVGKPYIDFVIDEDIEKTNELAAEIFSGKTVTTYENRYKRKDGGTAFNLWSVRYDPQNQIMFCVARDGKEKIKKEELLVESEQRFKGLVQEGSDLIGILDEAGLYTYVSPTSLAVLGIEPEAFIGKSPFDYIHPEDAQKVLSSLGEIAEKARVEVEPFRFQNKNGEWRWVETVLTNMLNNPAIRGIVANSRDITAKKKETQHLKLLESVITNTNDSVLITEAEPFDETGPRILYVNEAFTKLTGYTAEEVIGKTPRILQGPNSDKAELARLSKALRNWEPCEITTINYKKNGDEFWINFSVSPVADETGWYTHWISIDRDVTEQKNKTFEIELINTISDIFHESIDNDITICLSNLCELMIKFGDFDLAEVWLPAIDSKSINRVANYAKGKAGSIFFKATQLIASCALGEGLPGDVWKNKTIEIWGIDGERLAKRKVAAKKAGITAMTGVPLQHKDEVIGVLILGTVKSKKALTQYIDLLKKLEPTIGSELSRKKIEIELAQIFDFTPDLICIAGFDGYIKRINPAGLAMLGYSLEEIRSRPIVSFLYETDRPLTRDKQKKLYDGQGLKNFENRYVTKQGKIIWLSWTATSSIEQGVVYAVAKNITEEKNLRELNRQVGKLAKIGSWEVNLRNNSVFWSDITHEIHETAENFKPQLSEAINFYREDFREIVTKALNACIETGTPVDFEAVITTAKNSEVWVRVMASSEIVNGECIRIYGSFQDINQKKVAELRIKSLANNIPGAIFQFQLFPDGTDKILHLSKGVEKLWGIDAEAGMENNALIWDQMLAGGDIETVQASISESMTSLKDWYVHFRSKTPQGKIKWLEGIGTPRRLPDGSTIWDSIILDITHLKETEVELLAINQKLNIQTKELQRSNEELEQFAFITSHDLQEPLRMISSFMDQLKRKYADRLDDKGLQYIHFATDGAKRMKQIILDLLLYSRANKRIEQNEMIDLNEIVSEYTQLRRKVITEKSATITFHGLPSIETYRAPITQIFHCLLDNALKYVYENKSPHIEINAIEKENVWQFAIKDNGIGINPKFYDKIFIIFQRLQNRKEHDGTGIGLAVAKRSVEFLGGEIWVESEIDKGSTFYFTTLKNKQLI